VVVPGHAEADESAMTVLLYGLGANRVKHPVTTFESMDAAKDALDEHIVDEFDCIKWLGDDLLTADPPKVSAARAVADIMWDDYYFVADPPLRYKLLETDGEFGVLTVSDD
jgi:hypothetical protein